MTHTDRMPPLAAPPPGRWEQCDHCQAPLDERQRYCVACGARRPQVSDPVAQYFAAADQRARAGAAVPAQPAPAGAGALHGVRTAVLLALLPLAAAAGVFVGRGATDDSQLLVDALKAQKAPVVSVVGGGAPAAAATDGGDAATSGSGDDDRAAGGRDGRKAGKTSDGNTLLSRGRYGEARELTGARTTAKTREESRRALDKIVNSKGRAYVDSQRGLPDQIVIP